MLPTSKQASIQASTRHSDRIRRSAEISASATKNTGETGKYKNPLKLKLLLREARLSVFKICFLH